MFLYMLPNDVFFAFTQQLFARFERDYVCAWLPPLSLSAGGAVILVLGERVVGLPWESLSLLADKVVCRMPSLKFTTAHMHMVRSVYRGGAWESV